MYWQRQEGIHFLAFVPWISPCKRSIAMVSIPMHNETEYTLTDEMTQQITRDAQEHFGEEVRSIRVQYGIERHAFNARTREVRYAFSPADFGLVNSATTFPDTYYHPANLPRSIGKTHSPFALTSREGRRRERTPEAPSDTPSS
jgi:hypothetical protein